MLKKWWVWVLVLLFILINIIVTNVSDNKQPQENKLINSQIQTH